LIHTDIAQAFDLAQELAFALRIARDAGEILRSFYEISTEVFWKPGDEPVTEADRAANAYLVGELARAFPEDGILAEESTDNLARLAHRRVWLVDPLDGTSEFITHNDEFCVMIGLVDEGRPVLGVIYQPVADIMYGASAGNGAFVEQSGETRPLHVSDISGPAESLPAVSRLHRGPFLHPIMTALGVTRERTIGSLGLKSAALASGQVDFYIHPAAGPKEWDTCAPEAILREAGGIITDCWNRPLRYNQRDIGRPFGVLASNTSCRQEVAQGVLRALDRLGIDPDFGF
jgi:3'(2'), 5'-bisphosphate nucleotidase